MVVRIMNWRIGWRECLGLLVLAFAASWSIKSLAQESAGPSGLLEVLRIDGTTVQIAEAGVLPDGLRLPDGSQISWEEVNELKTSNRLLGDDPTATVVRLRGSGILQVRSLSAREGVVTMTTDLAEIKYPLLDIQSIRLAKTEGQTEWQSLVSERSTEEDRLLVSTSRGPRVVAGLLEYGFGSCTDCVRR